MVYIVNYLRALINDYRPGQSVRHIERTSGLAENKLGYWLKPGSSVKRMPNPATVNEIAAALGCVPRDVFLAFAYDLGYPVDPFA